MVVCWFFLWPRGGNAFFWTKIHSSWQSNHFSLPFFFHCKNIRLSLTFSLCQLYILSTFSASLSSSLFPRWQAYQILWGICFKQLNMVQHKLKFHFELFPTEETPLITMASSRGSQYLFLLLLSLVVSASCKCSIELFLNLRNCLFSEFCAALCLSDSIAHCGKLYENLFYCYYSFLATARICNFASSD